jgi:seryl-tRNA(Sec) selenium transferase
VVGAGVYEELGVRSFINCRAPHTRFGGAVMAEEVLRAMAEAGRRGVALSDLQERAGRAIASLTRNEAAYLSCGAASGITLAVAACMAGLDEAAAARLPDTAGMPGRVLVAASDGGTECDAAIRASGARIAAVGTAAGASAGEWRAALAGEGVAAAVVLLADERPGAPVREVVALARAAGVPVLIDAAAAVPPRANLWRWTTGPDGADAIVVSGGKGIGGPQSTGLVLGRQAIVDGCAFHGVPNVRIGRGMKVGKEEMAGIYVAVKRLRATTRRTRRCMRTRRRRSPARWRTRRESRSTGRGPRSFASGSPRRLPT